MPFYSRWISLQFLHIRFVYNRNLMLTTNLKKMNFFPPLLIIFIFFVSSRPFGAHLALNKLKKSTTKNSDRFMFLPSWPVTSWRWLHPEYFQALILSTHCAFPKKPFLPPGTNECVQAIKNKKKLKAVFPFWLINMARRQRRQGQHIIFSEIQ